MPMRFGHDPLQHLAFGFQGCSVHLGVLAATLGPSGQFEAFSQFEGVIVRNDDDGPCTSPKQVTGHEFAAGVVAVGIVR